MKTLMAAQGAMSKAQKEIEQSHFEGSSGGGLVKLEINGKSEILTLVIDDAVMREDSATASELVIAAFNSASTKKEALSKEKLRLATGTLFPIGFKIPGLS